MASNPLIDQGTLNKLRGSIVVPNFRSLNVTAPYLGKDGISLALEGDTVTYIDTLTGAVTSPEPYMKVTVRVALLKTTSLAGIYKAQMENLATIGPVTVKTDASTFPNYSLINCSIKGAGDLKFNGEDAGFGIMLGGYYLINNALWNV